VATVTTDAPAQPAVSRKRPIVATLVGLMAVTWGCVLAASGVADLLDRESGDHIPWGPAVDVAFAVLALLIAIGAFRVTRWGWALFMSWAAVSITINLLRVFFYDDPHYLALAVGTLTVFLLTPLDVQVAFRVRNPPKIRLGEPGRNPVDSV
jgi:hypothetical protein